MASNNLPQFKIMEAVKFLLQAEAGEMGNGLIFYIDFDNWKHFRLPYLKRLLKLGLSSFFGQYGFKGYFFPLWNWHF
ncbi:hypothetical protein G6M26_05705 [Agrobacterium tumefaciens]|nr:hypothetical protein [Agrobacterium tumefaciens]NTE18010.1 hypothetical protein [Agrobacterium tumefaciens]